MAYEVHQGDCLEVLKQYPDNYFDSVVTDPPYGIEFMGKEWDSFSDNTNTALGKQSPANKKENTPFKKRGKPIDGWCEKDRLYARNNYYNFTYEWAKECFRVLKPGGFILVFGSPRMYHRMTCAIEDVGFSIRDCIQWIYGCLSEDTEILTLNGWERYHKAIKESPVICYNIDKDTFELHKPERIFIYENEYPAYRIKSDFTDQIVSRNHRCIVERDGRKVFAYAETLERQESVPFLESLHDLPETIPYLHEGTSVTKQDLLERVRLQEYQQKQEGESNPSGAMRGEGVDNLPCMWEERLEVPKDVKEGGNTHLQQTVQRGFEGGGMEETRPQREGELGEGVGAKVSRAYDGGEQPSLEGRGDVLQKEGQLYGSEVCTMPRAVPTDGEERWLCYGTSADRGATLGENVEADRSRSSHRPQSSQQRTEQFNVICEQPTAQEVRSNGKTRTTLATITPIEYHGNVWCVQVPTGAFVARRNGHIFITGNSGFPKSMDISKAIDKKFKAKREVIKTVKGMGKQNPEWNGTAKGRKENYYKPEYQLTAPATPEAQQWDGWGTALKPAHEPIVVARKPLSEKTIAENVLKWGTGGINIDGCRIPTDPTVDDPRLGGKGSWKTDKAAKNVYEGGYAGENIQSSALGRFPANVILDEEAGKMLDGQSGIKKGNGKQTVSFHKPSKNNCMSGDNLGHTTIANIGDSGGASRFFYCAKASKKERGDSKHPTVKPLSLMRYLCRLITPPEGIVLDPFAGSGTTLEAAILEGFNVVGIEKEHDYIPDIRRRIERAQLNTQALDMGLFLFSEEAKL